MFGGLEQAPLVRRQEQVLAVVQGEFRRGERGDEKWWLCGGSWLGRGAARGVCGGVVLAREGGQGEQQPGGRKFLSLPGDKARAGQLEGIGQDRGWGEGPASGQGRFC